MAPRDVCCAGAPPQPNLEKRCQLATPSALFALLARAPTLHKTQALPTKHFVFGCLDGEFARGQVYILERRVADPENYGIVGVPPADLLDEIWAALRGAIHDAKAWSRQAVAVTVEWVLLPGAGPFSESFVPKHVAVRQVPGKVRTLAEVVDPQLQARAMCGKLLSWIACAGSSVLTQRLKQACLRDSRWRAYVP